METARFSETLIFDITEVDGFVTFIELDLKGTFVVSVMTFPYRRHRAGCWRDAGFESGLWYIVKFFVV
jgi:hypothetical protein